MRSHIIKSGTASKITHQYLYFKVYQSIHDDARKIYS